MPVASSSLCLSVPLSVSLSLCLFVSITLPTASLSVCVCVFASSFCTLRSHSWIILCLPACRRPPPVFRNWFCCVTSLSFLLCHCFFVKALFIRRHFQHSFLSRPLALLRPPLLSPLNARTWSLCVFSSSVSLASVLRSLCCLTTFPFIAVPFSFFCLSFPLSLSLAFVGSVPPIAAPRLPRTVSALYVTLFLSSWSGA